jgi:hypothetical protein
MFSYRWSKKIELSTNPFPEGLTRGMPEAKVLKQPNVLAINALINTYDSEQVAIMLIRKNDNERLAIWSWQSALAQWLWNKPVFKLEDNKETGLGSI